MPLHEPEIEISAAKGPLSIANTNDGAILAGIDIGKHLPLPDVSLNPAKLVFDVNTYRDFRDRRLNRIGEIVEAAVNLEKRGVTVN